MKATGLQHICKGILAGNTLVALDLQNTKLDDAWCGPALRRLIARCKLKRLCLKGCFNVCSQVLVDVCKGVAQGSSLVELDLSNNNLGEEGMIAVGDVMASFAPLARLRLSDCRAASSAEDWHYIPSESSFVLTNDDPHPQTCSHSRWRDLFNMIPLAQHMADLDISWNDVGPAAWKELAKTLAKTTGLTKLDVSGCFLDDVCWEKLCSGLEGNRGLSTLILASNSLNQTLPHGGQFVMDRLVHAMKRPSAATSISSTRSEQVSQNLQHLNLSGCARELPTTFFHLCASIQAAWPHLTHLDISNNLHRLDDDSHSLSLEPFTVLLTRLPTDLPALTFLDLSNNCIDERVMTALGQAVGSHRCLRGLHIAGTVASFGDWEDTFDIFGGDRAEGMLLAEGKCPCTHDGFNALCKGLAASATIEEVNVGANLFPESWVGTLSEALGRCRGLVSLMLDDCPDLAGACPGFISLCDMISSSTSLVSLSMCGVYFHDETAHDLMRAVAKSSISLLHVEPLQRKTSSYISSCVTGYRVDRCNRFVAPEVNLSLPVSSPDVARVHAHTRRPGHKTAYRRRVRDRAAAHSTMPQGGHSKVLPAHKQRLLEELEVREQMSAVRNAYLRFSSRAFVIKGPPLRQWWSDLGLPRGACAWSNEEVCEEVWRRGRAYVLAFAMALHPRLGVRACARVIDDNLLRLVAQLLFR